MTPAAFRVALVALYGSGSDYHLAEAAAPAFGVSKRTLYRWLAGDVPIPTLAMKLAQCLRRSGP